MSAAGDSHTKLIYWLWSTDFYNLEQKISYKLSVRTCKLHMYNTRVATCAPARKSQLTQATHKTVGTILLAIARSPRRKWGIPSPRCAYGLEAFDFCCWCAGCDDCCCLLWCGPCALDQLARQEYLASNGYSVEYDFYAPTGVVPGVQYARPPV